MHKQINWDSAFFDQVKQHSISSNIAPKTIPWTLILGVEAMRDYMFGSKGSQAQKLRQEDQAGTLAGLAGGHMSPWSAKKKTIYP